MTTAADIVNDLLSNNICKYCTLRFINERNTDLYNNVDDTIAKLTGGRISDSCDTGPVCKQKRNNPCSACLGLLQLSDNCQFIDEIVKAVRDAGHDADDVTFALSLPITFLLRNCSVWLYVYDKYLNYFVDKSFSEEVRKECNVVSVKEAWKWIAPQKLAEKLKKNVNNGVDGNFHVNIQIEYEKDDTETSCLIKMFPQVFQSRSSQKRKFHGEVLTRKSVELALMDVDIHSFKGQYPVPPPVPDCFIKCSSVECVHDSIYLAGRYNKLSRSLSQTPWMINGERRMESSVEEIIGDPVSSYVRNDGIKFSSSGREDVDVRTLGKGRPFVLDISNPRRTKLDKSVLTELEKEINSSTDDVRVRDLQLVPKEELRHIKLGEQEKTKTYKCFCVIKLKDGEDEEELKQQLSALSAVKNLTLQQRTPVRVLHRRPLAVRPRIVFWLEAAHFRTEGHNFLFKLRLQVEAGTYIKEFVHGDFGRTSPNLSEIMHRETDILALDVEEVALNWPPYLEYNGNVPS